MLSDIIAPGRLRAGDPQALAALLAIGGWSVVVYCERAGAGDEAARAVLLAFVKFRRRAIHAGDEAAADLERILLDSARDAVEEARGREPTSDEARSAEEAFARASPRPLSPRLATLTLRALVEAAPVDGDPAQIRAAAERGYAAAYEAAEPAPPVAGEEEFGDASALLLRAAQGPPPEPDPEPATTTPQDSAPPAPAPPAPAPHDPAPHDPAPQDPAPPVPVPHDPPPQDPQQPARRTAAAAAILARLQALPPARRAVAFAAALVALVALIALLGGGGDDPPAERAATVTAPPRTATVAETTTTTPAAAASARSQVVRGTPRTPLSASGARFEIVPIAGASWAQQIRDDEPRSGTRWVTVAVRSRNVRRRDLVLRTLGYRLRTERGVIVGPRVLEVAEGPQRARAGRMPAGSRASVHLGFEVPSQAASLSIAFEPGGLDEPTVLVPIGPARQGP